MSLHWGYESRWNEPHHLGLEGPWDEEAECELPPTGHEMTGEQCDNCGGSEYTFTRGPVQAEYLVTCDNCLFEYRARLFDEDDLIW